MENKHMGNKDLSGIHKLTEMAIVISDNEDSKAKIITQDKKRHFIFCKIKIH